MVRELKISVESILTLEKITIANFLSSQLLNLSFSKARLHQHEFSGFIIGKVSIEVSDDH